MSGGSRAARSSVQFHPALWRLIKRPTVWDSPVEEASSFMRCPHLCLFAARPPHPIGCGAVRWIPSLGAAANHGRGTWGQSPLVVATDQRMPRGDRRVRSSSPCARTGGGSRTAARAELRTDRGMSRLGGASWNCLWGCMGESHNAHDRQHAERAGRKVGGVP